MAKSRSKKKRTESPTCNCLLLCEDVTESKATGKHVLHGIIEVIRAPGFPLVVGPFVGFMRLSNVYGKQEVRVSFERADTQEPLIEFVATTHPKADPLGVVTSVIPINAFVIPDPGRYIFSATHQGLEIASSPIFFEKLAEME